MEINYNRVLHFLVVAKHMNMNSAAEELMISQPAVSASIRKLEEELGLHLFYRHKNKLILSNEAITLMPYFQQMQQDGTALERAVNRMKEKDKKEVRISFTVSSALFSALFMTGFLEQYHAYKLDLSYVTLQQAEALLLNDETDFSITSPPLDHIHIKTRIIFSEPIGIVLPEKHPLAARQVLDFSDIEQLTFHGLQRRSLFRNTVEEICKSKNVMPFYVTESTSPEYFDQIKKNDGKHAFFSTERNYETNFVPEGGYVYRAVDDEILSRKFALSWKNGNTKYYQYEELLSHIEKSFPGLINMYNKINQLTLIEARKAGKPDGADITI